MEKIVEPLTDDRYLILFDGVCNLCNGFVQFVIKRDPKGKFVFAPLQSALAEKIIKENNLLIQGMNTVILVKEGKIFKESDVAIEVSKDLSGQWPLISLSKYLPSTFRNNIYRWIAKNRYRWFGKKDQCMIPTPELNARFLS